MKWLIEKSRFLALVPVLGLQVGALAALYVGIEKLVRVVQVAVLNYTTASPTLFVLLECLDSFLIALALIVISVSLYELFVDDLSIPDWMKVKNLTELKAKFGVVLIPIMAVKFLQKLLQSESALETMYYGIAIALVSTALTVLTFVSEKEKEIELEQTPEEEETRAKDLD